MKKYLALLISVLLLLITSCSSNSIGAMNKKTIDCDQNLEFKDNNCSFTLAILPDTQRYTENRKIAKVFYRQTEWIKENYEKYNIQFTAHLGDIVHNAKVKSQWKVADKAFRILDKGHIPYGVTAGNHDLKHVPSLVKFYSYPDDKRKDDEYFLKYFSPKRFKNIINYGGHSSNSWNSYYYFTGNYYKYLILFIDLVPSQETIKWASDIINQEMLPTIIVTHKFLEPRTLNFDKPSICDECINLWEDLIYENNQIFMTINGHYPAQDYELRKNKYGNEVFLIVVDYQNDYNGGNGMLRLIEFDEVNNLIINHSFSPYVLKIPKYKRSKYDIVELVDNKNNFIIEWDFEKRFDF